MAINYSQVLGLDRNAPPTAQFQQGFGFGQFIRDRALAEEQARLQAQSRAQAQFELNALAHNPNSSPRDFAAFMLRNPRFAKSVEKPMAIYSGERKKEEFRQRLGIFTLLKSGRIEEAKAALERRAVAAENAGDVEDARGARGLIESIDLDPRNAIAGLGITLSHLGGEKFAESYAKMQKAQQGEELHPGELAKQDAEVEKIDAQTGEIEARRGKISAETESLKEEAPLRAKQLAAQTGLTLAKVKETQARTNKLSKEAQAVVVGMRAARSSGQFKDREKLFNAEKKLRDEYFKKSKDFIEVQDAYRKIRSAEPSAAGDLSMIFSYMKMLDPGSVVREGEFANASNAGGISDKIRNTYNKILSGQRLTPGQRKSFLGQSRKLFSAAKKRQMEVKGQLSRVVKNYDMNPDNVFGDIPDEERTTSSASSPVTLQSLADKYR